ncbi:uncharacterized protein LOC125370626 [Ricinus communis]|uniref:uncharacterized protein LOC125370626 n=1 Tax=Ricinus communis TaxID=3988 RepID=UPI00201A3D63|nr:uncharacterized protein LOC125370626 [Ricinus communis]
MNQRNSNEKEYPLEAGGKEISKVVDLVESGFEDPDQDPEAPRLTVAQKNELKEKQKKDAKALFFIQQSMDDAIFPRVMGATTSKEAWDLLQEHYQGSSKVIKVKLHTFHRDFENLSMKSSDSAQDYSVRISALVNQIRALGEELTEQKIVEKVLRSLPPKFDHVVAAIEESKDLSDYSLVELMGSLESHEARLNRSTATSVDQAFQIKADVNKSENSGRGGSTKNYQVKDQANFHEEKNNASDNLFVAYLAANVAMSSEVWYLDSGCNNHITGNKNYFMDLDESKKSRVTLGNNSQVQVCGIGTVAVDCKSGRKYIHNVMYIASLANNLLSLGQLLKKDYYAIFDNEECMIYDKRSRELVHSVKMFENKIEKAQALDFLKQFKAEVEKEYGSSIITLRTDHREEFMSKEFELFCSDNGIQRQLTASYTPQ